MDRQRHWQDVYTAKDETAVSWFQARPQSSLDLITSLEPGKGARIVDVGGGASRLVDCLLDLGHAVSVLDIAGAALDRARAHLGDRAALVGWVEADVTRWTPSGLFEVWHDRAVFHFLTEAVDRQAYAAVMANAVEIGGWAVIGTFALDGPERCSGLPVRRYDCQTLAAEFAPRFRLHAMQVEDHVTPGGAVQKFQFCVFQRI